jgi:hypothetical protein
MLVNKHPLTTADVSLEIAGLKGSATLQRLDASNAKTGPREEKIDLNSHPLRLPPYSVSALVSD